MRSRQFISELFKQISEEKFNSLVLETFTHQYENIEVYHAYCDMLKKNPENVKNLSDIPFLPIEFFKSSTVLEKGQKAQKIFLSSGTTGQIRSTHHVSDLDIYNKSLMSSFRQFIGEPREIRFFSLLPSYTENSQSSLIYMIDEISSISTVSQDYSDLLDQENLIDQLISSNKKDEISVLFGVSFALLELAEQNNISLTNTTIIETGGMKGRRKEITRNELHSIIKSKLRPKSIVSEYGMTELLSQAYAVNGEVFKCPPWMKILIREIQDPMTISNSGSGGINVIDLCNLHSCSFIATNDLGKLNENGSFEVLGRFDYSDIRGCNLLHEMA